MNRINAVKRSSLADLSVEWDESCYAYVRPATYEDMVAIDDAHLSAEPPAVQAAFQRTFVEEHFISGKIKIFEEGSFSLVDMQVEDCSASRGILDKPYADIVGVDLDPKDLAALQAASATSERPQLSSATTATPSSEDLTTSATPPDEK